MIIWYWDIQMYVLQREILIQKGKIITNLMKNSIGLLRCTPNNPHERHYSKVYSFITRVT